MNLQDIEQHHRSQAALYDAKIKSYGLTVTRRHWIELKAFHEAMADSLLLAQQIPQNPKETPNAGQAGDWIEEAAHACHVYGMQNVIHRQAQYAIEIRRYAPKQEVNLMNCALHDEVKRLTAKLNAIEATIRRD